jgi:hypothetical protein
LFDSPRRYKSFALLRAVYSGHFQKQLRRVTIRNLFVQFQESDFVAFAATGETLKAPVALLVLVDRERRVLVIVKRAERAFFRVLAKAESMH